MTSQISDGSKGTRERQPRLVTLDAEGFSYNGPLGKEFDCDYIRMARSKLRIYFWIREILLKCLKIKNWEEYCLLSDYFDSSNFKLLIKNC